MPRVEKTFRSRKHQEKKSMRPIVKLTRKME